MHVAMRWCHVALVSACMEALKGVLVLRTCFIINTPVYLTTRFFIKFSPCESKLTFVLSGD